MRSQLDSLRLVKVSFLVAKSAGPNHHTHIHAFFVLFFSMTVHEVVGRVEMSGRQILMLEEDRDRLKSVLAAQDEILNQKISA